MSETIQQVKQLQQAVVFFQHPDRVRLLDLIYQKYIALGRVGGQVTLKESTHAERREIASFLKIALPPHSDISVRVVDFQHALSTSSFACELPTLLAALFPERSQITNLQRREQRSQAQAQFASDLEMLAQQAHSANAQRWLNQGHHGLTFLFRHYKNASPAEQTQLLAALHLTLLALDQLPQPPTYERLAPFATRISGDPHYFDPNTTAGRLFYHALYDLSMLHQASNNEIADESESMEDPVWIQQENTQNIATTQRLLLYYDAGLLLDTISSTVAVYNLSHASTSDGQADPLLTVAQQRLLVLPLHQLLRWQTLTAASQNVYLFENPQVFEEVIDTLQQQSISHPTLICTAGWPSTAATRLLDILCSTNPSLLYHYSGDFDLQGLRIAAHLHQRYPANLRLWHFTPRSYLSALHQRSSTLTSDEIHSLRQLPAIFQPLTTIMTEQRQKAYQESLLPMLIADVIHSSNL